jgi:hypothetical protein
VLDDAVQRDVGEHERRLGNDAAGVRCGSGMGTRTARAVNSHDW